MSTEMHSTPAGVPHDEHSLHLRGFDREVRVSWVLLSGIALTVVTVLSFVACWWGLVFMERLDRKHEAAKTMIQETLPQPQEMMLPALQVSPQADLKAMRAGEKSALEHPAWADGGREKVDLSIDEAIDALVQRGVAPLEGSAQPAPAAGAAPNASGTPTAAAGAPGTAPAPPPSGRGNR